MEIKLTGGHLCGPGRTRGTSSQECVLPLKVRTQLPHGAGNCRSEKAFHRDGDAHTGSLEYWRHLNTTLLVRPLLLVQQTLKKRRESPTLPSAGGQLVPGHLGQCRGMATESIFKVSL